jgi:hypothetical protein
MVNKDKPWCFGKKTVPMLGTKCFRCETETYHACVKASSLKVSQ